LDHPVQDTTSIAFESFTLKWLNVRAFEIRPGTSDPQSGVYPALSLGLKLNHVNLNPWVLLAFNYQLFFLGNVGYL